MPDYVAQRANMVTTQIFANGVTEERMLDAFREVPRELFVPAEKRGIAYAEVAIEVVPGRRLLPVRIFAKPLELAEMQPGETVLDVGCATGYSTAVIARLGSKVIGLEEDATLVRIASELIHSTGVAKATIAQGALADGYRSAAPYDVIIVEGGVEEVPESLLVQLGEGGRLVTVLQRESQGRAIVFLKEGERIGHRFDFDAAATVLRGFRKPATFVF